MELLGNARLTRKGLGSSIRRPSVRICHSLDPDLDVVCLTPSRNGRDVANLTLVSYHRNVSRVTMLILLKDCIEVQAKGAEALALRYSAIPRHATILRRAAAKPAGLLKDRDVLPEHVAITDHDGGAL